MNCHTDRWTNWAQSMMSRHERVTARQALLLMTLVEPIRMFTSINARFENFAFAVLPRIQISIRPILQEIMHEQLSAYSFLHNSSKNVVSNRYEHRARPVSLRLVNSSHQTDQTTTRINSNVSHNLIESRQTVEAARRRNEIAPTPLCRLFARLHTPGSNVVDRKLLVESETQRITERVLLEHSRVEVRKRDEMVIRKQLPAEVAAEKRRSEIEPQLVSSPTRSQQPWLEMPTQMPQINVDQLTEQVIRKLDHRITAYRERLGRGN